MAARVSTRAHARTHASDTLTALDDSLKTMRGCFVLLAVLPHSDLQQEGVESWGMRVFFFFFSLPLAREWRLNERRQKHIGD